jgi:glyoxylase-like metal-dependent hydrolase (beta-lactamase superfamily II)
MDHPDNAPEILSLDEVGDAWREPSPGLRHEAVLAGARKLRARMEAAAPAVAVRTLPITTLPYPTRYAFQGAAASPAPFVTLTHRCLLVRFRQGDATRTLLFNPTDVERSRKTPFFAKLEAAVGSTVARLLSTQHDPLETQLARLGVTPADVDYVAFDHFHTQDLRGLLGTVNGPAPRFPNATLLAPRVEWEEWGHLHPMQRAWYVAEGREGVRTDKVLFTDGDVLLGDGVMLVRTPGHTVGNQTLFVKTERGVWGCSENGTAVDNWSPARSRIAGVALTAKHQDLDVILNANTPEGAARQYTAMSLEKALVDPVAGAPEFVQMFPSSEVTPSLLAPGLSPSYMLQKIESGEVTGASTQKAAPPGGFGAAAPR